MSLLLVAALCALIYLLKFCHSPASWAKTAVKTGSIAALLMFVILTNGPVLLIAALGFCGAGDYLLSRDNERAFLAGVGSFAAGHIAYIALFLTTPMARIDVLMTSGNVMIIAALVVYGAIMMRQLFRKAGALRYAVIGYVPVILAMGVAALCVPTSGMLRLVVPSALLFMISDSVLAGELFLLRDDHPLRRATPYVVWSFYWLAQFGFLLAFSDV
ncbi:MAG: lysoplasmalogenase [Roseovarius sp.]|nr:lysoplasmalogenase [Roseovarius sp.]